MFRIELQWAHIEWTGPLLCVFKVTSMDVWGLMTLVVLVFCLWKVQRARRNGGLAERWTHWGRDKGGDRIFCGAPCFLWKYKGLDILGLALKTHPIVCVCLHVQPWEGVEKDTDFSWRAAFWRERDVTYFIRITLITVPRLTHSAIQLWEQESAGAVCAVCRGKGAETERRLFAFILLPTHGSWARGPISSPAFFLCCFL